MCTPVREVGEDDARAFDAGFDECFGVEHDFATFATDGYDDPRTRDGRARTNGKYYRFAHNTRAVRSNFVHFQLRNLVWATSKNDAYVMSENRIVHWNAATRRATTALDLDGGGGGGPPQGPPQGARARAREDGGGGPAAAATTTTRRRRIWTARAVAGLSVLGENAVPETTAAARRSPSPETSRASR